MIMDPGTASIVSPSSGWYELTGHIGLTDTAVVIGDQILKSSIYYDIQSVVPVRTGTTLQFYKCGLTELSLWQAVPGTLTWSLTRPNDPRERTKVYIDTYVRDAQITKDNDSTQALWACIFSEPPYPTTQEFRAASNPVFGLYVVEMPNSTPTMNHDLAPYGYDESVPIHIITVDSTACTGTALNWKMEAEMRYVCETYPEGSKRSFEFSRKLDRNLGDMWLYDRLFTLSYWRDTS